MEQREPSQQRHAEERLVRQAVHQFAEIVHVVPGGESRGKRIADAGDRKWKFADDGTADVKSVENPGTSRANARRDAHRIPRR